MKSRIRYSAYVVLLTSTILLVFYVSCIALVREKVAFFVVLSMYVIILVCGLLYGAWYLQADPDHIVMASLLRKRRILMRDVASAELFQPTMGAIRIWASGGFMGYWGIFKEGDIGRYYAFYGKSSDCFLVRMKNGDKYVLGCENPSAMVAYIQSNIR